MNKNAPVWTPKATQNSNDSVQETVVETQSTSMETTSNNQNSRGQNRRPRNRGQGKTRRGNREAPQQTNDSSSQENSREQTSAQRGQRGRGRGYRNSRGNSRGKSTNTNPKSEVQETFEKEQQEPEIKKITTEGKQEVPKSEKPSDSIAPKTTQVLKKKVDGSGHSTLAADIIERLNNDTYECMICTDTIKKKVAIWHCTNCFHLFHLFCIKKWGKSSDDVLADGRFGSWRCPGCQHVYVGKPTPRCYCGKTTDPQFDPYFVPHSCGETCGKKRLNTECPHPCPLMCHPGHCPPCAQNGPLKTCYCGKQSYRLRCGEKDKGRVCGQICNKKLNCGQHQCMDLCHEGPCKPCQLKVKQTCYCGRACEEKPCGSGKADHFSGEARFFSCGSICAANLTCGHHQCESKCHAGACSDCKLLPKAVTTCSCGKIPLQILYESLKIQKRKSCIDPIPTCPNTCDKQLPCGTHNCKNKCHNGPCSPCTEETKAPCRCHSTSVTLPCNVFISMKEPILCNKVCKSMKVCGRHTCGNRCCPSSHLADPTGADVEGVHICNLVCGKKLKCGKHKCDLLCHAGKCPPCHVTIHEPYVCECGATKVEPPILCGQKIPPCQGICVRPRPCGHPNKHLCHSKDDTCPPCPVTVERTCSGGHDVKRHVACHLKEVSCGRICRKILPCGQHNCKRLCHADACMSTNTCGQICGKKLPYCEHSCQSVCHPGEQCPRIPCKQLITITCPCKRRSAEVECLRNGENDIGEPTKRELICDDICEMEERNRRLAEAFGHVPEKKEEYSDFLIDLGKASPLFIAKIEKRFEEFLKSGSSKFSFPSMDRIQRKIIHELATKYNFETESFDKEPNRNVVISKRKNSRIPSMTLSTIISQLGKHNTNTLESNMNTSNPVPATYAIHLSELTLETKTQHINFFLRPFEPRYQLKWIDDFNALVLFTDYNEMKAALYVLTGPFHATEYKDYVEVNSTESSTNLTPKIVPKAKSVPVYEAPSKPWAEDKNYFSAFHSTEWDAETKENEQPKAQKSVETMKESQNETESWETI